MAEIAGWFTMNGKHIPYMKGQSKAEAAKKYMDSKHGKEVARLSKSSKGGTARKITSPELKNKIESEYKNWKTSGQIKLAADELPNPMPKGTIITVDIDSPTSINQKVNTKLGKDKWKSDYVVNGKSSWSKVLDNYETLKTLYNDIDRDTGKSRILHTVKVKYK